MHSEGRTGAGRTPRRQPRRTMVGLLGGAIAGVLVVAGLVILITYLVILPHKPKYYVDHASVSEFNWTRDGRLLNTHLNFDIRTRNPNKKIAIYYYRLQAFLLYEGEEIGWGNLPIFYQGHKNTTVLKTSVIGKRVSLSHADNAKDLRLEQQAGTLDLDLRLLARLRFKVGSWKSKHYTMKVKCQHVTIGVHAGAFKPLQCKVHV